jgi:hypothetical protein
MILAIVATMAVDRVWRIVTVLPYIGAMTTTATMVRDATWSRRARRASNKVCRQLSFYSHTICHPRLDLLVWNGRAEAFHHHPAMSFNVTQGVTLELIFPTVGVTKHSFLLVEPSGVEPPTS